MSAAVLHISSALAEAPSHHAWRGWLEKGVANALLPPMPQDGEAGRTGGPAIWCNAGCANG